MLKQRTKQWLYIIMGWVFFVTGFVGIFLPVLPTTPFMILTLWCFSRGSEHLHQWLYHHEKFGPMLQQWDQYGVIPLKAKVMAVSLMSASAIYLLFFSTVPHYAVFMSVACMIGAATYVLSRNSKIPAEDVEEFVPALTETEFSG